MSRLEILHYPDSRLRTKAQPVTRFDHHLATLIDGMFAAMYAARGIGLAATQVDVHQRVMVADVSEERGDPICLINPEIIAAEGREQSQEGCLSVPDTFEIVERPAWVRIRAQNPNGDSFELAVDGLLATCLQHEIDHLDGILFIDRLSSLKRVRIRKRFDKNQRHAG